VRLNDIEIANRFRVGVLITCVG